MVANYHQQTHHPQFITHMFRICGSKNKTFIIPLAAEPWEFREEDSYKTNTGQEYISKPITVSKGTCSSNWLFWASPIQIIQLLNRKWENYREWSKNFTLNGGKSTRVPLKDEVAIPRKVRAKNFHLLSSKSNSDWKLFCEGAFTLC